MTRIRRTVVLTVAAVACVVAIAVPSVSAAPGAGTAPRTLGGSVGTHVNWPCSGCVVYVPPAYKANVPTAILVALHGDEGVSSLIASVWAPVVVRENVILFAPQCPTDKGCRLPNGSAGFTNSWWGWLQSSRSYDDGWIASQVNTIAKRFDVDRSREYLTGWSGGADYLGWYAPKHASQFAAVAYVVGGVPYDQTCPSKKLAAYFLMGSADFRYLSGQPSQVRGVLQRCGDPTKLVVLPGLDHQGTVNTLTSAGYGHKILAWLLRHRLTGA